MSVKFSCNKDDITSAINNVSKAVSPKSTIAALEGIKLKLENSSLELTGYDLEIGITTSVECNSSDNIEIILNSRLFNEITRRMPSDIISYEIDDNLNIRISGGNAEYQISAIGAEEYPALPQIEMESPIVISQSILKSMINQTVYAVSVNDSKPIMTGELFDIDNNSVNIVAIDGFRLAIRNENIDYSDKKYFVVPSKALKEASGLLSDDEEKQCSIYVNTKYVLFDINGYRIFTRLLEGEFHNYRKSVPSEYKTEVIAKTSDIAHCLERCSLLLNEKNKAPVKCKFENGTMSIECKTAIGRLDDSIDVEVEGDSTTIGFNNKFLLDALRAADTDKVKIQMSGPNRAVKILPCEGEHFTFIVMPVQLRG